ncbi:MAG: FmdB family zinc ribbon protein [Gemmatimonadota bacterium]
MPTYVYKCRDCDQAFERFEKMTASTRSRKCPACGGRATRQISGGAGFLFKGEGFYITDYRSQEYRSKASADKPAEPAPTATGEKAAPAAAAGAATPASGKATETPSSSGAASPASGGAKPPARATRGAAKPAARTPKGDRKRPPRR